MLSLYNLVVIYNIIYILSIIFSLYITYTIYRQFSYKIGFWFVYGHIYFTVMSDYIL